MEDVNRAVNIIRMRDIADYRASADDPGCRGAGLCFEASADLSKFFENAKPRFIDVNYSPYRVIYSPGFNVIGNHWVMVTTRRGVAWAVDLTARQFNDALPFPYFWRFYEFRIPNDLG